MKITKEYFECSVCHNQSETDNLRFKSYTHDNVFMVQEQSVSPFDDGICSDDCVQASLLAWLRKREEAHESMKSFRKSLDSAEKIMGPVAQPFPDSADDIAVRNADKVIGDTSIISDYREAKFHD